MAVNFSEFYTVAQAAKALGVSDRRVRKLIEDGRLQAEQFSGAWLMPKDAVDSFERQPPGNPAFLRHKSRFRKK